MTLQTNGANISVDSATIRASGTGSQVLLDTANNAPALASQITLTDATLSADVLKVQALGTNGTLTIGGSSTLTGSTQLLLYAGNGSGAGSLIEFVANTTLNSNAAGVLAAYTVKIDNGVQVTVTGPGVHLYATSLQFTRFRGRRLDDRQLRGRRCDESGQLRRPGHAGPVGGKPGTRSGQRAPNRRDGRARGSTRGDGAGRRRTMPFEAVQPFLVQGGPALPAHLTAPASPGKHGGPVPSGPAGARRIRPAGVPLLPWRRSMR